MNPIRLRQTPRVICASAICAALLACAGNQVTDQGGRNPDPLNCPGLKSDPSSYSIINGDRDTTIEYPQHNGRLAVLKIPGGAVATGTKFTIGSSDQDHVQIDVEARDGAGNPITNFRDHPLTLIVFVHKVCTPYKPEPGKSFYLFRIPVDSGMGLGHYDHAPHRTPRVTATLDHLSGYILAQGIVR